MDDDCYDSHTLLKTAVV